MKKKMHFQLKKMTCGASFLTQLNEAYLDSHTIYLALCLPFNIKLEITRKKLTHPKCRLKVLNQFNAVLAQPLVLNRICTLNMDLKIINDLLRQPFQPMRSQTVSTLLCIYNEPRL